MKDLLIAGVLAAIVVFNLFDIATDFGQGMPLRHIVEESIVVLASGLAFLYIVADMRRRYRDLDALQRSLAVAEVQLRHMSAEMARERHQFAETIRRQFEAWELTEGEQQVAMLLLKGLSFREIAVVRDTREKTVRQQASSVYGKSGIEGRHAFAAWFLEDFMESGPDTGRAGQDG